MVSKWDDVLSYLPQPQLALPQEQLSPEQQPHDPLVQQALPELAHEEPAFSGRFIVGFWSRKPCGLNQKPE